ncbi:MAG: tetratricopeptide repeat protein [Halopseudomonas sp.]
MNRQARQIDRWMQQAVQLHQQGNLDGAEKGYRQVLAKQKRHPDALHLLGLVAHMRGNYPRALQLIRDAIKVQSANPEYHYNLGNVEKAAGRFVASVRAFKQCLKYGPNHYQACNNLANTLDYLGRPEEAQQYYQRALAIQPHDGLTNANFGQSLMQSEQWPEARSVLKKAMSLSPGYAEVQASLALLECHQGNFELAEQYNQAALALKQGLRKAQVTAGYLKMAQGQRGEARRMFNDLTASATGFPDEASERLAMLEFFDGELESGFNHYEGRIQPRYTDLPRLTQAPTSEDRLLVVREQGIGDEIRYARFLHFLNAAGIQTAVLCEPRLQRLLSRSFEQLDFISRDDFKPSTIKDRFSHEVAIASLGQFYPLPPSQSGRVSERGFLRPDTEQKAHWADRLTPSKPLRIGLAWRGAKQVSGRKDWYPPLESLLQALSGRDARVVSLQNRITEAEQQLFEQYGIELFIPESLDLLDDQDGLAALIANMDLVIGPSSAVSELSAALGIPTWIVTGLHCHMWSTSEAYLQRFYLDCRVFAHELGGGWEGTMKQLVLELDRFINQQEAQQ